MVEQKSGTITSARHSIKVCCFLFNVRFLSPFVHDSNPSLTSVLQVSESA